MTYSQMLLHIYAVFMRRKISYQQWSVCGEAGMNESSLMDIQLDMKVL